MQGRCGTPLGWYAPHARGWDAEPVRTVRKPRAYVSTRVLAASALHALRAARCDGGLPRGVGGAGQLEEPLVVGGAVAWN